DPPPLEFFEAGADVGPGHVQGFGDLFGVQGILRDVQQRMDLGDGPVNAPAGAHLTPVQDELLLDWRQFFHLFLSVQKLPYLTDLSSAIPAVEFRSLRRRQDVKEKRRRAAADQGRPACHFPVAASRKSAALSSSRRLWKRPP